MNGTMGTGGMVPTLLIFGLLPKKPTPSYTLPDQHLRMAALRTVRDEMATIVPSKCTSRALSSRLPPACTSLISPGDSVSV